MVQPVKLPSYALRCAEDLRVDITTVDKVASILKNLHETSSAKSVDQSPAYENWS